MDNLFYLKSKMLLKELDFIESDWAYKNELINKIQNDFIIEVNKLLDYSNELKTIFNNEIDRRINSLDILDKSDSDVVVDDEVVSKKNPQSDIKKLYREIVKITHPDKVSDISLNKLYLTATQSYESGDFSKLYSICDLLSIEYSLDNLDELQTKIDEFKLRIEYIEKTLPWIWYKTENKDDKTRILLDYIRKQIS